jgi:hypothetical protein
MLVIIIYLMSEQRSVNSVVYRSIIVWNSLPTEVKLVNSVDVPKRHLIEYTIAKY